MRRLTPLVLLFDLVLLAALYLVQQDLGWRNYYAGIPHAATSGYVPSFSYSVGIRYFTMSGGAFPLTSPPTLDWVQVIVLLLVLANGWLAYQYLKSRATRMPVAPTQAAA